MGRVISQTYRVVNAALGGPGTQEGPQPFPKTSIRTSTPDGALIFAPEPLPEPDAAEMAVNVTKAAAAWIAAGMPVVTQAQHDERAAICAPCEFWDGSARLGLGKCKAPGCGCTKFKRWLATEVCKHPAGSRWPKIEPSA